MAAMVQLIQATHGRQTHQRVEGGHRLWQRYGADLTHGATAPARPVAAKALLGWIYEEQLRRSYNGGTPKWMVYHDL